jgi:hypothetical protein
MAKKEIKLDLYGLADAVSVAFSTFTELQDEMQQWYDNMPENFQGGSKGEEVQEAADTLANINELELPTRFDDSGKPEAERVSIAVRPLRLRATRADRCSYAVELLSRVKDELEDRFEKVADDAGLRNEIEEFTDELQGAIDEAESVSFPGMY